MQQFLENCSEASLKFKNFVQSPIFFDLPRVGQSALQQIIINLDNIHNSLGNRRSFDESPACTELEFHAAGKFDMPVDKRTLWYKLASDSQYRCRSLKVIDKIDDGQRKSYAIMSISMYSNDKRVDTDVFLPDSIRDGIISNRQLYARLLELINGSNLYIVFRRPYKLIITTQTETIMESTEVSKINKKNY